MIESIAEPATKPRTMPFQPNYGINYPKPSLPTQDDLPYDDGVPMETERHKVQMDLLIYSLEPWLEQQGSGYVGGNMFVYFSSKQELTHDFKGPDVFVAKNVSNKERKSWLVWEEKKPPDVVIELLSESTKTTDKNHKKTIYQNKLKVPEYYWFDPFNSEDWAGFELKLKKYRPIPRDAQNRLVSQELGLALVRWHGIYNGREAIWLRWETLNGELLLTPAEAEKQRAEAAEQRADSAEQRADTAEAEIARLKALYE